MNTHVPHVVMGVPVQETPAHSISCESSSADGESHASAQAVSDEELSRELQREEDTRFAAAFQRGEEAAAYRAAMAEAAYHADRRYLNHGIYYHAHVAPPPMIYTAHPYIAAVGVPPGPAYVRRGDWYMEECAYCNWETQVFMHELRFRCANCGREQATGNGVGKSNWCSVM